MENFNTNGCQRAAHQAMVGGVRAENPAPSMTEILAMQQDLGKNFQEFKAKNDERLKEMEKKGSADPLLNEQIAKINASIGDQSKRVDDFIAAQEKITDGIEMRMQRMGLSGFPSTDPAAQAQAFFQQRARRNGREFKPEEVSVDSYKAFVAALDHYIRQPESALHSTIRNDLSVGSDKDGGYLVSPERSTEILKRLLETSPIRQYARSILIGKDKIVLPRQTSNLTMGGWGTEKEEPSKTGTQKLGEQTIEVFRNWAMPQVTQDFLDDADIDVMAWIDAEAMEQFSLLENAAFVNGDGAGKPRGFMSYTAAAVSTKDASRSWDVVQYVAGGHASELQKADPLIDLVHSMKAALRANARWASNRYTMAAIRKLKDGNGNYIWSMGDIKSGQPSTLLGYPTAEFEDMADIGAGTFPLAFSDFDRSYLIVDRKGLSLLRDPYSVKPFVQFYYYSRKGGDVRDKDALKYLKIAAT